MPCGVFSFPNNNPFYYKQSILLSEQSILPQNNQSYCKTINPTTDLLSSGKIYAPSTTQSYNRYLLQSNRLLQLCQLQIWTSRHTKINIPFNLARRIRTIVSASDKEKTTKRMNQLNNILQSKEYPPDLITSAINKAKDIPQGELRKVKAKTQDKNTLAFVSTYNHRTLISSL